MRWQIAFAVAALGVSGAARAAGSAPGSAPGSTDGDITRVVQQRGGGQEVVPAWADEGQEGVAQAGSKTASDGASGASTEMVTPRGTAPYSDETVTFSHGQGPSR